MLKGYTMENGLTFVPAAAAKSLQSYPTLCDPIDGSPPGSPIPGILQARTLEWAAISFSSAWKWKVKVKALSSWPHGLQPTRLLHPWDFPGKSTGVGCHCLLRLCTWSKGKRVGLTRYQSFAFVIGLLLCGVRTAMLHIVLVSLWRSTRNTKSGNTNSSNRNGIHSQFEEFHLCHCPPLGGVCDEIGAHNLV